MQTTEQAVAAVQRVSSILCDMDCDPLAHELDDVLRALTRLDAAERVVAAARAVDRLAWGDASREALDPALHDLSQAFLLFDALEANRNA